MASWIIGPLTDANLDRQAVDNGPAAFLSRKAQGWPLIFGKVSNESNESGFWEKYCLNGDNIHLKLVSTSHILECI